MNVFSPHSKLCLVPGLTFECSLGVDSGIGASGKFECPEIQSIQAFLDKLGRYLRMQWIGKYLREIKSKRPKTMFIAFVYSKLLKLKNKFYIHYVHLKRNITFLGLGSSCTLFFLDCSFTKCFTINKYLSSEKFIWMSLSAATSFSHDPNLNGLRSFDST